MRGRGGERHLPPLLACDGTYFASGVMLVRVEGALGGRTGKRGTSLSDVDGGVECVRGRWGGTDLVRGRR